MNLQQLHYARAVSDCESFVEAARRCGVSQPTLSNGIAQLERELGHRLFARTTRSVRLTEAGRHIVPAIEDVLAAQGALLAKARALSQPERHLLRIGVSPLAGIGLVSLIVDAFRRSNGDVDIVFREMNLAEMNRQLETGQLDFAFGPVDHDVPPRAGWASVPTHREKLVYIGSSANRLAEQRGGAVTLKDIAEETFVLVPDSCGLTAVTRAVFRRQRLKLREYPGEAMSYRVLQEWAQLGVGSAILPRSKAGAGLDILLRKGSPECVEITYHIYWRGGGDESPGVQRLGDYLAKVAPSIAAGLYPA